MHLVNPVDELSPFDRCEQLEQVDERNVSSIYFLRSLSVCAMDGGGIFFIDMLFIFKIC